MASYSGPATTRHPPCRGGHGTADRGRSEPARHDGAGACSARRRMARWPQLSHFRRHSQHDPAGPRTSCVLSACVRAAARRNRRGAAAAAPRAGSHAARGFLYRLPRRASGCHPGSHRGSSSGPGQEFIAHERLYDHPDPRRLDLRASLANVRREWLVRATRQRASIRIQVILDVSASMAAGVGRSKLAVAAEFLEALGQSAFRAGDAVGMLAFDARLRTELCVPALRGRGAGPLLAGLVRDVRGNAGDGTALRAAGALIAARTPLVFLVSDFHWPLHALRPLLDALTGRLLVPLVLWAQ